MMRQKPTNYDQCLIKVTDVDVRTICSMAAEIMRIVGRASGVAVGLWCNGRDITMRCTDPGIDPAWRTVEITHGSFYDIQAETAVWFTKGNSSGALAYYLDCVMETYGAPRWSDI